MNEFTWTETPSQFLDVSYYQSAYGVALAEASRMRELMLKEQFFTNGTYLVNTSRVDTPLGAVLHISVLRRDGTPCIGWSDLQEIKNYFVGPENEALEVFPAESRLVGCGPQRHLWCFLDSRVRLPFGWTTRMVRPY